MATVFQNHKGVLLVGFHDCGDTVTDECYYGTERLCQDIQHKMPGTLCQGLIILPSNARHYTANHSCARLQYYS
jgi:hypothetical protein